MDEVVKHSINEWVSRELAPWRKDELRGSSLITELHRVANSHPTIFLIRVEHGSAHVEPKATSLESFSSGTIHRVRLYEKYFSQVVKDHDIWGSGLVAVQIDDLGPHLWSVPIFAFQKRRGSNLILMPDVDLIEHDLLTTARFRDQLSFDEKESRASFVGSTTGLPFHTASHVAALRNPRLRSAVFFKNNPKVSFTLPNIVQYDLPETRAMIEALEVGGGLGEWSEQFRSRYLISMDGNGATCSRLVIALASNSVPLKYNSPHLLYFFYGLHAWTHYIPIVEDNDVNAILEELPRHEHLHRALAMNSALFAENYLNRASVEFYLARLLSEYLAAFDS